MKCVTFIAACAWQSPSLLQRSRVPQLQLSATPTKWSDLTDEAQRLTDAQAARTVAAVCSEGVLISRATMLGADGAAFASHAPFVVDEQGCPLTPLSSKEGTANLEQSTAASFFACAPRGGAAAGSGITLVGNVEAVSADDIDDATLNQLSQLIGASVEEVAKRPWRRLMVESVHLQDAVRGSEAWVPASEYSSADPNPLAPSAAALLTKINTMHMPALKRFAAVYAGVPAEQLAEAELLGVDQLGFDLMAKLNAAAPATTMRIGFKQPPANEEEGISVFMKLFQEAYERENGFMQ